MNIVLIGFMGSGKSSVAHELEKKLKCKKIETDELVLSLSGRKSIKEIFERDGEVRFRKMEIAIAKKLSTKNNTVISTGGGMVINKICVDYLKQNGAIIYLNTSFEEITKRLEGDDTRPLFSDKLVAQKLFKFRKFLYKEYADIIITTDGISVNEISKKIYKLIH